MLERMQGKLGEHHSGALRLETAEAKAERIMAEELARLGWEAAQLTLRRKNVVTGWRLATAPLTAVLGPLGAPLEVAHGRSLSEVLVEERR
jgi:hypothetical protein